MPRKPRSLKFIPDVFKTQEMCNKTFEKDSCALRFFSLYFWTHGMSNKAIEKYIYPVIFNTQEICERVFEKNPYMLKFVPDHFDRKKICDKQLEMTLPLYSVFPIGLSQGSRYKCGMIRVNIVIICLSGTIVIKNGRL